MSDFKLTIWVSQKLGKRFPFYRNFIIKSKNVERKNLLIVTFSNLIKKFEQYFNAFF